jgi:predicted porin
MTIKIKEDSSMKATKLVTAFGLTAIAMAVSTSSHAYDLVKSDNLSINFNGDIDLKIINSALKNGEDSDLEIEANFDDFDFDFEWKIDDSLSFIAGTDWTVESDEDNDVINYLSWSGLKYNDFQITAGLQEDAIDPLGIDSFEILSMGRASGEQDGSGTVFAESILTGYKFGKSEILASYVMASEEDGTDDEDDYEGEVPDRIALYGKTKQGDFQFEAGIGQESDIDDETTVSFWQVQAEYTMGPTKLGVLYSTMNVDTDASGEVDSDSTGIELNITYEVNKKLDLYAGYEILENDLAGEDDYVGIGIGGSYAFSKFVKLYIEAGTEDGTYVTGKSTNPGHSDKDSRTFGMLLNAQF